MTTISQVTIPYFVRMLNNMSAILTKAEQHAIAKKYDPNNLLQARLAPDMFCAPRQVQIACDMTKLVAARLAGRDAPVFPDDETTFEQLRARVAKTLDYIQSVPAADIDAGENRTITMKTRLGEMNFTAYDFVFGFAVPNLHFHTSILYAIFRSNGVELGKWDFLGKRD